MRTRENEGISSGFQVDYGLVRARGHRSSAWCHGVDEDDGGRRTCRETLANMAGA